MNSRTIFLLGIITILAACKPSPDAAVSQAAAQSPETAAAVSSPSAAEAVAFVAQAEQRLAELGQYAERMAWVQSNFITYDTERLYASASEAMTAAQVEIASAAARFIGIAGLDRDIERKLHLLRTGITIPAPGMRQKMPSRPKSVQS